MVKKINLDIIVIALTVIVCVFFIFFKFTQFQRFDLREDFTLFENILWNSCNSRLLLENSYGNIYFSQHFSPLLFLLIPIYCVFQSPYFLLVIDGLVISLALIPLYLISKQYTNNKYLIFAVLFSFIFSDRLFNGLSSNFYMEVFYPLFLFILIYFMLKEKWILYWIFFFLVITVKEDSNIVLFGIGLFLLLKKNFKIGILSIIIPLIIFPATILYIIPAFPHPHRVSEIAFIERWNNFGTDVNDILVNMINPLKEFTEIATAEKIKSVLGILRQFLLLPIINFKTIILLFPYLFFVLSSNYGTMYRFEYHYALILIPILYLAFFENLKWLQKFKIKKLGLIVAVLLILTTFYSIRNICINISPNMKQLEDDHRFDIALDMISKIPNNEGISVSKTLISRVPVRYERHYLPYGIEKSNYVIVYTKEQTSGYDKDITPVVADSLTKSSNWKIVREEGDFIMFSRN